MARVPRARLEAVPRALDLGPGDDAEQLAGAVVALAAAFGGRSVATAEFATREPDQPFMLAARPGEPVVAQLGGDTFAFPDGWP